MKFFGGVGHASQLNFGGDADHDPNPGIFYIADCIDPVLFATRQH